MKINIFIQARMGSSRLPGKVLSEVCGKPLLLHLIKRLSVVRNAENLVILTSRNSQDDKIERVSQESNIKCFRGDEEDVLNRYNCAAKEFPCDAIARITGDCPLIDPDIVEAVIDFFKMDKWDYVSNTLIPSYPDGLDVEVFSVQGLKKCDESASEKHQREHVTSYFYDNPHLFRLANYRLENDFSYLRWLVDNPEDLDFVRAVYEELYPKNQIFKFKDILNLLGQKPHLKEINSHLSRNEGFFKGKLEDDATQCSAADRWKLYIQQRIACTGGKIHDAVAS